MFKMPCCKRSGIEPKFEKSWITSKTFGTSPEARPISGVAHKTTRYWLMNGAKPSISAAPPSSPWPYTTPRAGCAVPVGPTTECGTRQRNSA